MPSKNDRPPSHRKNDINEMLPDRTHLSLDVEDWAAFQAALDAPARPNPRVKAVADVERFRASASSW